MSRMLCAECQEEGREEGCGMCLLASWRVRANILQARGDRLAEAALHITRCHDLSCTGAPCTCGLTELIAAIEAWEGS